MIANSTLQPGVQQRHCACCGDQFTTRHKEHYYCSVRCRRAATGTSPELASALSILADPSAPVVERIDRLDVQQLQAMVYETGRILGRV